ncbi:MAG: twin-arginine translocase subunit TatC [Chloroflexia bacterium]|nr:twin-arginine translocase subunit TatC [Chloroflexia bacterium]
MPRRRKAKQAPSDPEATVQKKTWRTWLRRSRGRPVERADRVGADLPDQGEMTLLEHLQELRRRLIVSLVAVGIGTVVGLVFTERLMYWLLRLLESVPGVTPQAIEIPEKFTTSMRLALTVGVALAMPVIVYQLWKFLQPGLYAHEQRYIVIGLPLVSLFFASGVAFAYYVALPAAINFLLRFGSEQILTQPRLATYLSFVSTLLFWSGVSFETPIFIFFLAKLGVVDWKKLLGWWKYALLAAFVLGAVITPTPDPLNMSLVALPLYLLYWLGILLARFA